MVGSKIKMKVQKSPTKIADGCERNTYLQPGAVSCATERIKSTSSPIQHSLSNLELT